MAVAGLAPVNAASQQADAESVLAGIRIMTIPGWESVMVKQDPLTDAWKFAFAMGDGIIVTCNPDRETYPSGLSVSVELPRLGLETGGGVDVEYRIGQQQAQTGTWRSTTGPDASSVTVPDALVEDVLRAERLTVRVQEYIRVPEWSGGDVIYELMSDCAGWPN